MIWILQMRQMIVLRLVPDVTAMNAGILSDRLQA